MFGFLADIRYLDNNRFRYLFFSRRNWRDQKISSELELKHSSIMHTLAHRHMQEQNEQSLKLCSMYSLCKILKK